MAVGKELREDNLAAALGEKAELWGVEELEKGMIGVRRYLDGKRRGLGLLLSILGRVGLILEEKEAKAMLGDYTRDRKGWDKVLPVKPSIVRRRERRRLLQVSQK